MRTPARMGPEAAQSLAIAALRFLSGDIEVIGRFLAVTGIGPGDLRAAAAEPGFLAGVLEFVMEDESLLLAFAADQAIRPTMIAAARYALAGDNPSEWS